ncbi:dephospho-CoA kinase [Herbiconiux sp. KACC 21604]|uniref:dephospho-CoA kinase n=1 Tax=unclassified Herbiconiux TaxID=2618217 RepID=UPI001492572D|nr:dephospho-CoA kinase [Herbiconiux sp. SALV-R1]QJU53570.1 dephospho-CoA kinase [Herbiconiux sp. SALV-R1]WPO88551.1 dephospho-CoA kinase [Herbiconiux sp. KACC 21604]
MNVIGLTGGIAAGKSTVAKRFADHGAIVIDADKLAREAVEPGTPGLAAIADRFGASVIAADGTLDRAALGAIVFSDDAARLDLNGITHPAVAQLLKERLAEIAERDPDAVVVYDVPLLAETGGRRDGQFGLIVVVEAPAEQRIARLVELRGMSPEEAARRVGSQASDADRRALADIVIDSGGTLAETLQQVDEAWPTLLAHATKG